MEGRRREKGEEGRKKIEIRRRGSSGKKTEDRKHAEKKKERGKEKEKKRRKRKRKEKEKEEGSSQEEGEEEQERSRRILNTGTGADIAGTSKTSGTSQRLQ
ncbi:hypothetical protein ACOSQ2_007198 [Xanthoceras sorbifolium]